MTIHDGIRDYLEDAHWRVDYGTMSALQKLAALVDEALASNANPPRADDEALLLEKRAFIEGYAKRCGLTVEGLLDLAYPCNCGEPGCEGWRLSDRGHRRGLVQGDNETCFLIRYCHGETHVTEHDEEGLLEVIKLLRPVKSTVGCSDTSEWGDGFLVIRGEIVRLNPQYTTSFPRHVTGWEID